VVGEILRNFENKTGLSHKSTNLNVVPSPSITVLSFGTYKLRCTLIGFLCLRL
jgi:hypothetical protein